MRWETDDTAIDHPLTETSDHATLGVMTLLQLKQEISRLTLRERRELNAYMIRLRHERPEYRKTISRRMREMDAGKKISLDTLESRLKSRG